jgi:hypothetical protein
VLSGPIPYGWEDYGIPPDQLPFKTDLEQAKKLMADAGFAKALRSRASPSPSPLATGSSPD